MPNPYPGTFLDLLAGLPPGAVALDLGSGGRRHPGVLSVEITPHPHNSVVADCLALPFRESSVDLILSQAVIEHVTDPAQAFREMRRVLRPGGTLYVEIAFMQPVHQAPHHYFNVTPYGLAWLLRDWDVAWQGLVGTPDEVVEWILRSYGARGGVDLSRVTPERYGFAASGVSALARRPL